MFNFIDLQVAIGSVVKNLPAGNRTRRFDSWVRKITWRGKQQPTPVLLPGKSHVEKSLVGYSPWRSQKGRT